jgi:hypothetical protein
MSSSRGTFRPPSTSPPGDAVGRGDGIAFDPTGNLFVGSSSTNGTAALDDAGGPPQGVLVARLDPQGAPVWSHLLGGPGDVIGPVAMDACGTKLYVGGSLKGVMTLPQAVDGGTITLNGGAGMMFLARLAK